jgi:hypothetical protein
VGLPPDANGALTGAWDHGFAATRYNRIAVATYSASPTSAGAP